jgi:murein DD-endopeptidase MepM/ murein hydrolase activator NlpD
MNKIKLLFFSLLLLANLLACKAEKKVRLPKKQRPPVEKEFGYPLNQYAVVHDTIQNGWTLSQMMSKYGVGMDLIMKADALARDSAVGLNYIRAGLPFAVFSKKNDSTNRTRIIVYQSSVIDYFVFDFSDSLTVTKHQRPTSTEIKTLSGIIKDGSSLTSTINQKTHDIGITGVLTESIAGVFAWGIDFFKLQPDDRFKVIYEENYVDGQAYGVGRVQATWFKHSGEDYYAFYYRDSTGKVEGYYDETGKEMKRMFLMAPVKFSRISSGYTTHRFHPVQKRWKSHLGTDYAAPTGTPIYSTANGTIVAATYSRFNGNYVKVKHDETYTTQYLHMSKIETGIHAGVYVKQGQTIGYVGSTGLATGPHVCYRFWKNGRQVDHRSLKFPASQPLPKELLPAYLKHIQPIKEQLDKIK